MKLWKNATFYTMDTESSTTHQVLTDQGVIIALGNAIDETLVSEVIDLKGAFVFPGFCDNHMHLLGYGKNLSSLKLGMNPSKKEVLELIRKAYKGTTLKVEGYLNLGITKNDLDSISKDHVIMLRHNDYHSVTVNSYALKLMNISHKTGIMIELEGQPFEKMWAQEPSNVLNQMTKASIEALHQFGITAIVTDDLSYYHSYLDTLKIIDLKTKENPLRAYLLVHHAVLDDYQKDTYRLKMNNSYLSFDWVKVFYDGTFSSKTALIKHPYKGEDFQGYRLGKTEFEAVVKKARAAKLNIAVHVIGDLGLEEVLEILTNHPPQNNTYDRIIHASLASMSAIKMMELMPVILDIQPEFISSDLPRILDLFTYDPMIYPFKSYLNHQLITVGSSDAPIEIPDPLLGIEISETREIEGIVYQKEERLSRFEAIALYTKDGIKNGYQRRGKIDVGYLADFSAFDLDLMKIDTHSLKNALVTHTIVDEKIVYEKK